MSKTVTLADLRPDLRNARRHNPRNVGMIEQALREIGAARSIVVDEHGTVLAGNATIEAAAAAGIENVQIIDADGETIIAVRRSGLTDAQKQRLALYDNRAAELADWDADMLAMMRDEDDDALDGLWFDEELAEVLASGNGHVTNDVEDPGAQVDRAAELQAKWGTERGQLWQIGRHRLLCGDATNADDVARLMGGAKADAVVTDPPYGIERAGITNDDPEGLRALFDGVLAALPVTDACVVAFQSPRLFFVWLDSVRGAGHKFQRMLWMYKPNDETFPWRGWLLKSEAILISTVGDGQWQDVHPYSHDVYSPTTMGAELSEGEGWHASVKPLSVVSDIAKRVSPNSSSIYDPFLGSGTTMVAAEQLGRICYGMEIEPKYVAVALERMAGMGLEPEMAD